MQKLVIHRAVRSGAIGQKFGENKACRRPDGKVVSVWGGSCPTGTVPYYPSVGLLGHSGVDVPTLSGEPVYHSATFDGWMKCEKDNQGGLGVDIISHKPLFFAGKPPKGLKPVEKLKDGFTSYVKMRYWHLKMPVGWDKKEVVYGQFVGLADNTGASSGDHLHWAPKWCEKDGKGINTENGYGGAFDPLPFYDHSKFAGDEPAKLNLTVPALTPQEQKEIDAQMTFILKLRLLLAEFAYKLRLKR